MDPVNVNDLPPDQWYNPPPEELGEVDLAGLRANLELTPDERLLRFEQLMAFTRELQRAGENYRASLKRKNASTPAQSP